METEGTVDEVGEITRTEVEVVKTEMTDKETIEVGTTEEEVTSRAVLVEIIDGKGRITGKTNEVAGIGIIAQMPTSITRTRRPSRRILNLLSCKVLFDPT